MSNNIYKFTKMQISEIADIYYSLLMGFYNLEKVDDPKILYLSKFIKDEVKKEGGKFNKIYKELVKAGDKLYEIESKFSKDDVTFNPDETICHEVSRNFMDLLAEFSKHMFMLGVVYGKNTEKYLNDYIDVDHA